MVVKFFPNKKGGSSKSIDYLLNEREAQGTARVLEGDPQITRDIIDNIEFKQKVTVGVLSFEEANISEELKVKMMKDFEATLFPGMEKEQYNILWVEHTDKGRLELNFVIPKIELTTQKALQPYYHKKDLPRVEMFQNIQNLENGLSNPKDIKKERSVSVSTNNLSQQDYETLNKTLYKLVEVEKVTSRKEIIELLKNNNIEVTREGKDSLSIKLPESKKARKFKGGIYSEEFTSNRELSQISGRQQERAKQYDNRDVQKELEENRRRLREYNQIKQSELREHYKRINETHRARPQEENGRLRETNNNSKNTHNSNIDLYINDTSKLLGREEIRESSSNKSIQDIQQNEHIRGSNIVRRDNIESGIYGREQKENINTNISDKKGLEDDITTSETTREIEATRRPEYIAYTEARKSRNELFKTITDQSKDIREKYERNSIELSRSSREFNDEIRSFRSRVSARTQETITTIKTKLKEQFDRFKNIYKYADKKNKMDFSLTEKVIFSGSNFDNKKDYIQMKDKFESFEKDNLHAIKLNNLIETQEHLKEEKSKHTIESRAVVKKEVKRESRREERGMSMSR